MNDNNEKGEKQRRPLSPVEKVQAQYVAGMELDAFNKGAGIRTQPVSEVVAPVANNDSETTKLLTTLVTAYSKALSDVVDKSGRGNGDGQPNQFVDFLRTEVKDMKDKLDSGGTNPMDVLTQFMEFNQFLSSKTPQQSGIEASLTATIEGSRVLVELEKIKLEGADRQRIHEITLEQIRHNMSLDMEKWKTDVQLKIASLQGDRGSKDKTFGTLQDLAVAIISGIEPASVGQPVAGQPGGGNVQHNPAPGPASNPAPQIDHFACPDCSSPMSVLLGTSAICQECGFEHIPEMV